MEKNKDNKILWAILGLGFLYLLAIFPPVGDDFNRLADLNQGLAFALNSFISTYERLNGRLAGNFLSFFFMPWPLRVIFKGLSLGLVVYLMAKIFDRKSARIFGIFMIFFAPIEIFREVIVWNAGFFNYIPPLVLILLNLYLLTSNKKFKLQELAVFLVPLIGSLFVENISTYLIFMPIIIYFCFKEKKTLNLGINFLGALAGNFIMFSSPVYRRISSGQDSYRSLDLENFFARIGENWPIFEKNIITPIIFILFFLILVLLFIKRPKDKKIALPMVLLLASYIIRGREFFFPLSMALYIGFYLSLIANLKGMGRYSELGIFAAVSLAISMGSLLLVSPVGNRNFFTAHLFNFMIILAYFYGLIKSYMMEDLAQRICLGLVIIKLVIFVFAYTVNFADYRRIVKEIEMATVQNKEELVLDYYSYPSLVHREDGSKIAKLYFEKYGTKEPIKVIFN